MTLDEILRARTQPRRAPVLPSTDALDSAVARIFKKWPDIIIEADEDNDEKIFKKFLTYIRNAEWKNVKMSEVIMAFRIAFLEKYKSRVDVGEIRDFAFSELEATTKEILVNALMKIYSENFSEDAETTQKLGILLTKKSNLYGANWEKLLRKFPHYLHSDRAADEISDLMLNENDPWTSLKSAGISDPLASGIMDFAHVSYVQKLAPELDKQDRIDQLFKWLMPEPGKLQTRGMKVVVESLLFPWLSSTPSDDQRTSITERLILLFGDPRLRPAKWQTIDQKYLDLMYSWLTKAELLFFTDILSDAQESHMWQPRRDFWIELYNEGLIEQAWVAFCPGAEQVAKQKISQGNLGVAKNRFGLQTGRANTSILIMKIKDKIFVDGCHSYKTHVWDVTDPTTPPLFKKRYDCDDDVRLFSPTGGKRHHPIEKWKRWVRRQIYAKVPHSNRRPINWDHPTRNFV